MRNAFVVLVSLCIGLTSGFIVPSGGLELLEEDHAILADNNINESEENKKVTSQDESDTGFIVLPFRTINKNKIDLETNENQIKDKELYEQHSTKQNNVNERSFIYINQKYKTPVVNQRYSSQDLLKESYKPVIANVEDKRKRYPVNLKAKKEYFKPNLKPKAMTKSLYFPPLQDSPKSLIISDDKKEFSINLNGNKAEGPHEYIELLKAPLLRPLNKPNNMPENALKWFPDSKVNYPPLNDHIPQKLNFPINRYKYPMTYYDNYGFPTPYGYQRSIPKFDKSDDLKIPNEINIRKLITENNNAEVSRLIDGYLKNSLEEQVTNERLNANNCSYSDCVLKSRKQYIQSRVNNEQECKCGRRLNMKRIRNENSNGMQTRETTNKSETVFTTEMYVTSKSSEVNDYSDMLAEEMNLKKLIEE